MSLPPYNPNMQGVYPATSFGPATIGMREVNPGMMAMNPAMGNLSPGMMTVTPAMGRLSPGQMIPLNPGMAMMGPSQPLPLGGSSMTQLNPSNYIGLRPSGGLYGGRDYQCAFPAPPPPRVYCQPGVFSTVDGRDYPLLVNSYGQSRPEFAQM